MGQECEEGNVELAREIKGGEKKKRKEKRDGKVFLHRLLEKQGVMEWVFKKSIKLAE